MVTFGGIVFPLEFWKKQDLSLEALGFYLYLLLEVRNLKDDAEIKKELNLGRDKFLKLRKCLTEKGLLKKTSFKNEKGQFHRVAYDLIQPTEYILKNKSDL